MGIKGILVGLGLFGPRPGRDGPWDYLSKRSAHKHDVELERVRNDGTQKAIQLLQPGMTLREGGMGWSREVTRPAAEPSVLFTTVASPLPPDVPPPAVASAPELQQLTLPLPGPDQTGDPYQ
jgi:hypothetical protein